MQIFVDADACPVVAIIEKIAKDNSVPVMLLCDTNHVLSSTYSKVVVVGAGADAVDYKLISICHKGDIVGKSSNMSTGYQKSPHSSGD